MTEPQKLPVPIVRALAPETGVEMRAEEEGMPTLFGHFSVFDKPYEVHSFMEGDFVETIAPGAFAKTISESRDSMRVLFDHGMDPQIGNKVLGPIAELSEDRKGAAYAVPLLDTSYNRDLVPGLEAGVYGASFRFRVIKDQWTDPEKASKSNPKAMPERTILEAKVMEFGPVTFPASDAASAGVRSVTDRYYDHLRTNAPEQYEGAMRSIESTRTPAVEDTGAARSGVEPPSGTRPRITQADRDKVSRQLKEITDDTGRDPVGVT